MQKLNKSELPANHTKDDFKCFGPAAVKDGVFEGTMLADLGCFKQGEVDSNKYLHTAVVQSNKTHEWFHYSEWGRVGVSNPQYQFTKYHSREEAIQAYYKYLHTKNDKRGQWVNHPALGKILQPKPGKDCYLVRPQTTRSTGLTDAKSITTVDNSVAKVVQTSNTVSFDKAALSLLKDLNIGTISYTRTNMVGNALPTEEAIDEARIICSEAQKIINKHGDDKPHKDIEEYTKLLYSRIPKKKDRSQTDWLLTASKVQEWLSDLDAYEAAVLAYNSNSVAKVDTTGYGFHLNHLTPGSDIYEFVHKFFIKGTRHVHSYVSGDVKILNIFEIDRQREVILSEASSIKRTSQEVPLHQPNRRLDIDEKRSKIYRDSGTWMLFHGTRSVNVGGIMRESLRLPKTLSNVKTNGAAFGSGIYFADDYKKSLGYTSYTGSVWSGGSGGISGRGAFIFVCDVTLGNPHVVGGSGGYQGPPKGYHSLFAKSGKSGVMNNEFITFNPRGLNLRYLVEFK